MWVIKGGSDGGRLLEKRIMGNFGGDSADGILDFEHPT